MCLLLLIFLFSIAFNQDINDFQFNNSEKLSLFLKKLDDYKETNEYIIKMGSNTAKGEMYELEGVDGFIQAFFNSGAQSVLSTLWPIDDTSAKIFMENFYKNYSISNNFSLSLETATAQAS